MMMVYEIDFLLLTRPCEVFEVTSLSPCCLSLMYLRRLGFLITPYLRHVVIRIRNKCSCRTLAEGLARRHTSHNSGTWMEGCSLLLGWLRNGLLG